MENESVIPDKAVLPPTSPELEACRAHMAVVSTVMNTVLASGFQIKLGDLRSGKDNLDMGFKVVEFIGKLYQSAQEAVDKAQAAVDAAQP